MNAQQFLAAVASVGAMALPASDASVFDCHGAGWCGRRYPFLLDGVRYELRDGTVFAGSKAYLSFSPKTRPYFAVVRDDASATWLSWKPAEFLNEQAAKL